MTRRPQPKRLRDAGQNPAAFRLRAYRRYYLHFLLDLLTDPGILRLNLKNNPAGSGRAVSTELIPLEYLAAGQWADVADVSGEPGWVSRLAEMGVRVGCRLRVLQPGSPCLLQVGESRLSLRGDWATQILVRPVPVH